MKIYGFDDFSVLKSGALLSRRISGLQSIDLHFNLSTPQISMTVRHLIAEEEEYCDIFTRG